MKEAPYPRRKPGKGTVIDSVADLAKALGGSVEDNTCVGQPLPDVWVAKMVGTYAKRRYAAKSVSIRCCRQHVAWHTSFQGLFTSDTFNLAHKRWPG